MLTLCTERKEVKRGLWLYRDRLKILVQSIGNVSEATCGHIDLCLELLCAQIENKIILIEKEKASEIPQYGFSTGSVSSVSWCT
jgi:hypothetical protein